MSLAFGDGKGNLKEPSCTLMERGPRSVPWEGQYLAACEMRRSLPRTRVGRLGVEGKPGVCSIL